MVLGQRSSSPPDSRRQAPERIGHGALTSADGVPTWGGYCPHGLRRTRIRAGQLERLLETRRRGAARPSSSPERRASARPGSRPSSRRALAPEDSRSSSAARSISSARSFRTSRLSRPCVRSESFRAEEAGSQLRVFEETLALLTARAAAAPVLLVLEDLHWADTSTLDLVVFLAHNLDERRLALLATYRADEPASAERVRRLADGARRSGSALVLELGPLARRGADGAADGARRHAAACGGDGRDCRPLGGQPVLRRGAARRRRRSERRAPARPARGAAAARGRAGRATQALLRLGAAAGRDVSYPLLRALAALPERGCASRCVRGRAWRPRRRPGDRQVPLPPCAARRGDLRHGPAGRARGGARAARRGARAQRGGRRGGARAALGGSGSHRRGADGVGGGGTRGEGRLRALGGLGHLERALTLWDSCPTHPSRSGSASTRSERTAELASQTGDAPRAVELRGKRSSSSARATAACGGPAQAAGALPFESGGGDTFLGASERAVELVPAQPPSPERRERWRRSRTGCAVWRHEESLALGEQALELARAVGAREAECRALTVLGSGLAYLGRGDEGLAQLGQAVQLAGPATHGSAPRVRHPHRRADDARPATRGGAARRGRPRRDERIRGGPHGADRELDRSAAGHRRVGRGGPCERRRASCDDRQLPAHAAHAPRRPRARPRPASTPPVRISTPPAPRCATSRAWRPGRIRRRARPLAAPVDGRRRGRSRRPGVGAPALGSADPRLAVRQGTARAGGAGGARRRPSRRRRRRRRAHARADAAGRRPPRRRRSRGRHPERRAAGSRWPRPSTSAPRRVARPDRWSDAADAWDRLERPPLAAYCRWRQAEALVAAGAPAPTRAAPLRAAHAVAARLGAEPLLRELELLAERARLDPAPPDARPPQQDLDSSSA